MARPSIEELSLRRRARLFFGRWDGRLKALAASVSALVVLGGPAWYLWSATQTDHPPSAAVLNACAQIGVLENSMVSSTGLSEVKAAMRASVTQLARLSAVSGDGKLAQSGQQMAVDTFALNTSTKTALPQNVVLVVVDEVGYHERCLELGVKGEAPSIDDTNKHACEALPVLVSDFQSGLSKAPPKGISDAVGNDALRIISSPAVDGTILRDIVQFPGINKREVPSLRDAWLRCDALGFRPAPSLPPFLVAP